MTGKRDWMRRTGSGWQMLSDATAFQNHWVKLTVHETIAPTGAETRYTVVRFQNLAVGALPIFDDGSILLVGQHRFPLMDYSWELPEGGAHLDEPSLEAAKRELREETGLEAADWREILSFQLSNSVSDERGICYLATGLVQAEMSPDATEDLQLARVPFREALALAVGGQIKDMITVATLLRAYHMAQEGELPADLAGAMLESLPQGGRRIWPTPSRS